MRHGYKLKRLGSGHPDHRYSYLKNLVSALLHHEMIQTTVPRAKIAARMAEKIITLGKKGTVSSRQSAISFLRVPHTDNVSQKERREMRTPPPLAPLGYPGVSPNDELQPHEQPRSLIPKVFETLAERYKDRPGGYTRIHKHGARKGDTAPAAILTLVDGPRDVRFEMLARQVGKEAAAAQLLGKGEVIRGDLQQWLAEIPKPTTRDVKAVLQFRPAEDRLIFEIKAREFADELAAEQMVYGEHVQEEHRAPIWTDEAGLQEPPPPKGRQRQAGERLGGMPTELSGLRLAKGALVGEPWKPQWQRKKQSKQPMEPHGERVKRIEQSHTPRFITQRRDTPQSDNVGQDEVDKPKVLEDVMREAGDVKPASASGLLGLLGFGKRT